MEGIGVTEAMESKYFLRLQVLNRTISLKRGISKILLRSSCFARPVLYFSMEKDPLIAPKTYLAPKPVSGGGPKGPRSELVHTFFLKVNYFGEKHRNYSCVRTSERQIC